MTGNTLFKESDDGAAQVARHVGDELMNRCFRDAMVDHRIHGFTYRAEWWLVKA